MLSIFPCSVPCTALCLATENGLLSHKNETLKWTSWFFSQGYLKQLDHYITLQSRRWGMCFLNLYLPSVLQVTYHLPNFICNTFMWFMVFSGLLLHWFDFFSVGKGGTQKATIINFTQELVALIICRCVGVIIHLNGVVWLICKSSETSIMGLPGRQTLGK